MYRASGHTGRRARGPPPRAAHSRRTRSLMRCDRRTFGELRPDRARRASGISTGTIRARLMSAIRPSAAFKLNTRLWASVFSPLRPTDPEKNSTLQGPAIAEPCRHRDAAPHTPEADPGAGGQARCDVNRSRAGTCHSLTGEHKVATAQLLNGFNQFAAGLGAAPAERLWHRPTKRTVAPRL